MLGYNQYGQVVHLGELDADAQMRGPFHPYVLLQVMTTSSDRPITTGTFGESQAREVAKVALWGIPVSLVLGAVGMHFWMKRKKRR